MNKIWIVIQFINLEIIGEEDKNKKKKIISFFSIKESTKISVRCIGLNQELRVN